jgi:hypothetical protein
VACVDDHKIAAAAEATACGCPPLVRQSAVWNQQIQEDTGMMIHKLVQVCAMGLAALCVGCQTAPLGGTQWHAAEVIEPDAEDRAVIEDMQAMLLKFDHDGKLTTIVLKKDGTAEFEDRQRFQIDDDVVTITHPDYKMKAMYRFEDGNLRLHSPQFVAELRPIRPMSDR